MANQRIKANLIPSCDIYPVIHLAQYDVSDGTGKQVEIELYYGTDKFTIPSGSSITFRGTKRDKTGYSYEITKFTDNVVTVDVKPQMTVLSGTHFAELRISKGNTISNTIKFVMKIDSSALADDTKVSETDLSVIEKALQASDAAIQAKAEADRATESSTSAKVQAEKAKASADSIANVTSDVEKLKEDLPNKITKFYASNQGETHITDSDNGKIQDMMIYGKSKQNQTKGKNLLKYPYIETTKHSNGITFTDNKDGSINVSGTGTETAYYNLYSNSDGKRLTLASGKYKLVAKGRSKCNAFVNNGVNSAKNEGTVTITDGHNDVWCFIEAPKGLAIDETIYPMIQLADSTDESYEPYTGGKPSPNPDYSQEIKSVVNPTIKLLGSNILKIADGEYQDGGVTATVSNGVVKLKGTANRYLDILLTANSKINFKEGTKVIFSPNNVKGIENKDESYLDFTNNNTIGFSIASYNLNTPYIIKEKDTKYPFLLCIRCHEGKTYDETWTPQVLIGETITPFKTYTEQTITLPITLNAIPVSSGGNVTINGQQYIADYVDVERGKLVKCVSKKTINGTESYNHAKGWHENAFAIDNFLDNGILHTSYRDIADIISDKLVKTSASSIANTGTIGIGSAFKVAYICLGDGYNTIEKIKEYFSSNNTEVYYVLNTPTETDLTTEQTQALKELATYYPVTNITVGSEQLDGYTVFNYPISLANGWNYVKQQLNDNRDYIYDMDLQSAEAYVNSEYAVTLTELEV